MTFMQKIKSKFFTKEFITFGMIGVCNTAIAQGLYIFFVKQSVDIAKASVLGDVLSMVFSYVMNMRFTYKQKMTWKSFISFPLSYIPGIIISALMVVLVVDVFNAPEIYAKLFSLPIYVPINFLCMNFIVKKFGGKKMKKISKNEEA